MSDMKGAGLVNKTFDGSEAKASNLEKVNATTARETPFHIQSNNKQEEYDSGKSNPGKLGARGQAGN